MEGFIACASMEKSRTKEEPPSGGLLQEVIGRLSQHLHDTRKLLHFILSGEQRIPCVQLSQDAAKGPHVYGHGVRQAQDHLRGAVETRLDVSVHCRMGDRQNTCT